MDEKLKEKILIVDDEPTARYGIRKALAKLDYELSEAGNGKEALESIKENLPDVVLSDIYMPEMDGLELLKTVQKLEFEEGKRPLIIMLTAFGSEKLAVEAMKSGAYNYLSKPFNIDELRLTIEKALEKISLGRENVLLKRQLGQHKKTAIVGQSPQISNIIKLVDKVAPTDVTVLLTGESGTGKELAAQTIHNTSLRHDGPFVTMNCAAIPKDLVESELFGHEKGAFTGASNQREGKFEIANNGTLFLDEVADMSLETQAKILRILEEKSFSRLGGKKIIHTDVRLISATNKDLQTEIAAGRFREDLFYRIKVVEIQLPPLIQRTGDIALLADHFVKLYAVKHTKDVSVIDTKTMQMLLKYNWPGNVRQLMHVIEQSVVLSEGKVLLPDVLPPELLADNTSGSLTLTGDESFAEAKERFVQQFEKDIIQKALVKSNGNVSQAARELKMKRQFLQQKMKSLDLNVQDYK